MTPILTPLEKAKFDFALTYCNTGCEWEEATEVAENISVDYAGRGFPVYQIVQNMYAESVRYEDM